MEYTVQASAVKKQGTGAKGPWTIYELTLENDAQRPTGFDIVVPGDKVTLETSVNGKYTNLNYKKVEGATQVAQAQYTAAPAPTQAPAPTAGGDPRILKLLVPIAEQLGIEKTLIEDILAGRK